MRILFIVLSTALALAACGKSSPDPQGTEHQRLFPTQRDALEKAKTVEDSVRQAEQARRREEGAQ